MNLQDVLKAEQDLRQFAAAFRSAKDLVDAIGAVKSVVGGIDEYEKTLVKLKAEVVAAKQDLAAAKSAASTAQTEADRAKASLENAKSELANLASKLFGGK